MPITVSGTSIVFNDSTTQTTAFTGAGGVTSLNGQTGAITNTGLDAIGSYIAAVIAESISGGVDGNVVTSNCGDTIAGSSLRRNYNASSVGAFPSTPTTPLATSYNQGGTALSGTYRNMGRSAGYGRFVDGSVGSWSPSMWVRIS